MHLIYFTTCTTNILQNKNFILLLKWMVFLGCSIFWEKTQAKNSSGPK